MIRNFGFLFLFRFGQLLFGLSASVNVESLAEDLLRVLSNDGAGDVSSTVASSEYKMRITVGSDEAFNFPCELSLMLLLSHSKING